MSCAGEEEAEVCERKRQSHGVARHAGSRYDSRCQLAAISWRGVIAERLERSVLLERSQSIKADIEVKVRAAIE
jgi:hypothetical protein